MRLFTDLVLLNLMAIAGTIGASMIVSAIAESFWPFILITGGTMGFVSILALHVNHII